MCRWIVYFGQPIILADVLVRPKHGLLGMSQHAGSLLPYLRNSEFYCPEQQRKRNHTLNGDGFGVGFYQPHVNVPGIFKSIGPAWSSLNLRSISTVIKSDHIFAHVRAATEVLSISQQNCHPFQAGQFMFMHNGGISGFKEIKRPLLWLLPDAIYNLIQGSTDSEHLFALFLCFISRLKGGQTDFTRMQVTAQEMALALAQTIEKVIQLCKDANVYVASSFNIAVSSVNATVCTRFRNNPKEDPPSLYLAFGSQWSHKWYDEPVPIKPTPVVRSRSRTPSADRNPQTQTQTQTQTSVSTNSVPSKEKGLTGQSSHAARSSPSVSTVSTPTKEKEMTTPTTPNGCLKHEKPKPKKECAIAACVKKCVKFYTVATIVQGEIIPETTSSLTTATTATLALPSTSTPLTPTVEPTTPTKWGPAKIKEEDMKLDEVSSTTTTSTRELSNQLEELPLVRPTHSVSYSNLHSISHSNSHSQTSDSQPTTPQLQPLRRVASAPDIQLLCVKDETGRRKSSFEAPHTGTSPASSSSSSSSSSSTSKDKHGVQALSSTVVISSEPVNESLDQWTLIPKDHMVILSREGPGEPVKVETCPMSYWLTQEYFDCKESTRPARKTYSMDDGGEYENEGMETRAESKKTMRKLLTMIFNYLDANRDGFVSKYLLLEFVNQLIPESEDPWFAAELLEIADFSENGISLRNWLCFFTKLFFHGRYTLKHLRKMSHVFPLSCETPLGRQPPPPPFVQSTAPLQINTTKPLSLSISPKVIEPPAFPSPPLQYTSRPLPSPPRLSSSAPSPPRSSRRSLPTLRTDLSPTISIAPPPPTFSPSSSSRTTSSTTTMSATTTITTSTSMTSSINPTSSGMQPTTCSPKHTLSHFSRFANQAIQI